MTRRATIVAVVALAVALLAGIGVAALAPPLTGPPVPLRAAPVPPADPADAGGPDVLLSADARRHPAAELVRRQLQSHYRAINNRDWAAWAATVSPLRSASLPEPAFVERYSSTTDGTIRIDRIDDLPGRRVLVRVRFVSTQDLDQAPTDAPSERTCWLTSLPMSGEPPRIEPTESGSSRPTAC